jgi:hypothetical protein
MQTERIKVAKLSRRVPIAKNSRSIPEGIVYAYDSTTELPISARLWTAMLVEFRRNGGATLTAAKVRLLRRLVSRSSRGL